MKAYSSRRDRENAGGCLSEMRTGHRSGEKNESKASKGYLTTKDTKSTKKGE